jgi:hypothetical protein
MKKSKKIKKKTNEKKGLSEEELEKLKKKIEHKFKELEEDEQKDEQELGEIESEEEFIDPNQFQRFMRSSGFNAPVLDQVEIAQNIVGLEQGVASESVQTPLREDPFQYNSKIPGQDNNVKYISSSAHMTTEINSVDFNELGRNQNEFQDQRNLFMRSPELSGTEPQGLEKYELPDRTDIDNVGRKDPFKREDKKYSPKLPQ